MVKPGVDKVLKVSMVKPGVDKVLKVVWLNLVWTRF